MYMLLFGYYPFLKVDQNGNVDPNLFWDVDSIINARYRYGRFKRSRAAIELLNGLLEPNPESRFSAEEALNHKWFTEPLPLIKLKKDKKAGIAKVSNLSVINREIQEAQQLIGQEDPHEYVL